MAQANHAGPAQRWTLVLLATTLALGLLVLTLLDYALSAGNTLAVVVASLVLGLLLILSIRIYRGGRGHLSRVGSEPVDDISCLGAALILLGITTLAAALRLYRLGYESLWNDETWTALTALQATSTLLRTVSPLPHLVAHLSLWLGRSEFVLRLGPAFAGVLAIPAVYQLGRALYGRREGLIAAVLLTVSVSVIYHSQELRFYAWQMLFSMLTLLFLLRGLAHRRWQDWAAFAVATVLNLHSHPYALFVLASEGLYTLVVLIPELIPARQHQPVDAGQYFSQTVRRLAPPVLAALAALVAFGPGWRHLAALGSSPKWELDAGLAAAGVPATSSWLSSPVATWAYELPGSLLVLKHPALLAAMFILFFLGLISSRRRQVALFLLWFLIPPLVLSVVRVRFYYRYLSYFLPLFLIVMARGIAHLAAAIRPDRQGRGLVTALITILVIAPHLAQLPDYYRGIQKEQWREAISYVELERQPQDLVLVTMDSLGWIPQKPFDWYRTLPDDELPWLSFPEEGSLKEPAQQRELATLAQAYRRVWFVLLAQDTATEEAIAEAMKGRFRFTQKQAFVHLQVLLFEALPLGEAHKSVAACPSPGA